MKVNDENHHTFEKEYASLKKSGNLPGAVAVTLITLYRIITAPLLLYLVIAGHLQLFKWLLMVSFLTDAIDGILARKLKVVSVFGARLDSIGDDLTFAVAAIGLAVTRPAFLIEQWIIIVILLALFFIQLFMALRKYGKMSSFHTYLAKTAAVLQALFLVSAFFFENIYYPLFYAACIMTAIELVEEIIMVMVMPGWKADVKGLYWAMQEKNASGKSASLDVK